MKHLPPYLQQYRDLYIKYLSSNYTPTEEDNLLYQNHASLLKMFDDKNLTCKGDLPKVDLIKKKDPIFIVPFVQLLVKNANRLDFMKDSQSFSSQKKMKETYELLDQIQILSDK